MLSAIMTQAAVFRSGRFFPRFTLSPVVTRERGNSPRRADNMMIVIASEARCCPLDSRDLGGILNVVRAKPKVGTGAFRPGELPVWIECWRLIRRSIRRDRKETSLAMSYALFPRRGSPTDSPLQRQPNVQSGLDAFFVIDFAAVRRVLFLRVNNKQSRGTTNGKS
jgi:hypothetical protein